MVATTIWSEPFFSKSASFCVSAALVAGIDDAGIVDDAAGQRRQVGGEGVRARRSSKKSSRTTSMAPRRACRASSAA